MEKIEGNNENIASKFWEICMVIADILLFVLRIILFIIQAIYKLFMPPNEKSVEGEIILITGTGHGIGKELARQYGALGAEVICVDINSETNGTTLKELKKLGYKAHAYTCDVCSREKVLELRDRIQSEIGDVTILINNAGIMPCKKFLAHSPEEIKKMFDVNVFAHFWTIEAFLPAMMRKDKGHIVGISSVAGLLGCSNVAPYCASKFAVRGLMEGLSEEFRTLTKHNIRFTSIYPYITDTGLCKKPVIKKFKNLMKILSPVDTARAIVKAQRRGYEEATVPAFLYYTNNSTKILPRSCRTLIADFLGASLDAHD